jgi:hypothetical protein
MIALLQDINLFSVVVAAITGMVIGFIYYSPAVFGKPWMKMMNLNAKKSSQMKKGMGQIFFLSFLSLILAGVVLSYFLGLAEAYTPIDGVVVGLLGWLGFAATSALTTALYTKKRLPLYLIDTGYYAITFAVMGAILVMWN